MVDINTWRSRIGTFNQKSKKVFHVLKCQGKKVVVSSCYFSCFVVSVNMEFNLFIAGSLESANLSILAAHRLFKEVVGKNQDFMLISLVDASALIGCGGDPQII